MKINKLFLSIIPILSIPTLLNCNQNKYKITKFVETKPDVYTYTLESASPTLIKNESFSGLMTIYLINDNDIPYISVKTGVNDLYLNAISLLYPGVFAGYSYENKNSKTILTNKANSSTCVIDYINQTMEFNEPEAFLNNDKNQVTSLDSVFSNGRQYFKNIKKEKYIAPKSSYIIDLKKYNIPIFYKDNEGYIPNEVFNNLLSPIPISTSTYFNNKFLMCFEGHMGDNQNSNKIILNKILNGSFSSKYMEYCYNLNAITLDTNYGLRSRESRALSGHTIKYNLDAYSNLSKYNKNNFLSTEHNIANQTLIDAINNEYDDSGHTGFCEPGFIDNKTPTDSCGYETEFYAKLKKTLINEQEKAGLDPDTKLGKKNAVGYFEVFDDEGHKNDTAFLTMNGFVNPKNSEDYKTLDPWTNSMSLTYYANNQLRANPNIKNFVLDLTVNGGGVGYVALFMSSWLTKGTSHLKTCSLQNNTFSDITYQADINGDNQIDDNDFLPSSVSNLYVIVSPNSFSCGNLLPVDLRDYTSAKFIGNRSGGGCCIVREKLNTGYGSHYQMSSNLVLCRKDADENNLITNDNGAGVTTANDYPIPLESPELYYDRQAIYDAITK